MLDVGLTWILTVLGVDLVCRNRKEEKNAISEYQSSKKSKKRVMNSCALRLKGLEMNSPINSIPLEIMR